MMSDLARPLGLSVVRRAEMRRQARAALARLGMGDARSRHARSRGSRSPRCNWSRSPAPSARMPACWCWTSRTRRCRRARASGCSRSSGSCAPRASPSSIVSHHLREVLRHRRPHHRHARRPHDRDASTTTPVRSAVDPRHGRPRPAAMEQYRWALDAPTRPTPVLARRAVADLARPVSTTSASTSGRRDPRHRRLAGFRQGRPGEALFGLIARAAAASRSTASDRAIRRSQRRSIRQRHGLRAGRPARRRGAAVDERRRQCRLRVAAAVFARPACCGAAPSAARRARRWQARRAHFASGPEARHACRGGNQQKIILGRSLVTNPRVLILHEPTRGIDVGAKAEIYSILRGIAGRGRGGRS